LVPPSNVLRLPQVSSLSGDDCRLLVESVVDYAIFMLDPRGYVVSWNPGAEKIKGYKAEEIVGQHFSAFYTPADIAAGKPENELATAAEVGRVEDEGWRIRKDGTRLWASVVITALRDETGKLRGYGKVTRDLTARKAAEERLRESEQRFHHLVDAVIDYAIFMLDESGRVATWNSGARRVKGYAPEEVIGRHFSLFYTPEDQAAGRPQQILDAVRATGRVEDESWRVRKDGTRFWANVVITALRDEEGRVVGFAKVTRDLSERRLVEEELRRSEERFRLLVENIGDYAIYLLDLDGNVATWNLGAERMKGYTSDEIVGRSFAIFFPEEDVAAGKPRNELLLAQQNGRHEDEGWRVRKDGTRFWANAILTALHDSAGTLVGYAKITRDLTIRREAEENQRKLLQEQAARDAAEGAERRLRESEERYRALSQRLEIVLEGVADGITVQDRTGNLVFANAAAAKISGFELGAELMSAPASVLAARFEMLDEQGRPFPLEDLPGHRVLRGEKLATALVHVRHRVTRREWWTLIRASAVTALDGTHDLAINIWHDVTEARRQERQAMYLADASAALATSLDVQQMLSTLASVLVPGLADWCSIHLLEHDELRSVAVAHADPAKKSLASDYQAKYPPNRSQRSGIWNVLRTGATEVWNDITDEMLTASVSDPEQLAVLRDVGMKAALVVPITFRSRTMGALSLVCAGSDRRFGPADIPLVEELGRRAGVALENAHLYAAAQDAARAAEEASRAKDEFLATVSHELRTPLNAILGWSSILKEQVKEPSVAKPVAVIHRNAEAQVRIIDDILDVSRVITGKLRLDPKPADLVAIVRDALEAVRASAVAKEIELTFRPAAEAILLVADGERLQQVVWNLLSNAVKFTDSGGHVTVDVRQEGSTVIISVADDGKGIDAAFVPFVFDRFKQADSSFTRRVGGLGLGLALVRHIVELHGGRAEAHSEGAGKGAVFTVTLPVRVVTPEVASGARPPKTLPPVPTKGSLAGVRVLVVDDESDARDLVAAVLEGAGAVVETAPSAAEGFAAFKRFRPDVLVSDIGMPDEDGLSLLRRIRALPRDGGGRVPALALSAFAREEDRMRALASGFTTHVGKPVDPAALASAVRNLATVAPSS
jgi:PAS domain S-box-containing protein